MAKKKDSVRMRFKPTADEVKALKITASEEPISKTKASLIASVLGGALGTLASKKNRVIGGLTGAAIGGLGGLGLSSSYNSSLEKEKAEALKDLSDIKNTGYRYVDVDRELFDKLQARPELLWNDPYEEALTHSQQPAFRKMFKEYNKNKNR